MPGEIDEESIIENKPAIKNYWETKMKENAASQFARSNFGTPAHTIIDKINEEIREDYLRNLELMTDEGLPRSSASDTSDEPIEFDSFDMASGGGSPFGQPNDASSPILGGESPTLVDSGHQSQQSNSLLENDNDNGSEPELLLQQQPIQPQQVASALEAANQNRSKSPVIIASVGFDANRNKQTGGKVAATIPNYNRDIVDTNKKNLQSQQGNGDSNVSHYIQFNKNFPKIVKPLKEATPERDLSRQSSSEPESVGDTTDSPFASTKNGTVKKSPIDAHMKSSSSKSDISYILATTRLKKEIEDNLKREKELKEQGRVKTLSVETVTPVNAPPQSQASLPAPPKEIIQVTNPEEQKPTIIEDIQKPEKVEETTTITPVKIPPPALPVTKAVMASAPVKQVVVASPQTPKPTVSSKPFQHRQSFDDSTKRHDYFASKQEQPKSPNFKIGKNFNSLERYIMYSSLTKLNFRSNPVVVWTNGANNNSSTNDPEKVTDEETKDTTVTSEEVGEINVEPARKLSNSSRHELNQEPKKSDEPQVVEKVRKNYIPTQKRIESELLEMMQREEELKRSRQHWKSTPNLNNINDEEADAPVEQRPSNDAVVRRETEKRRRSALISKWEDMISKNNQ